MAGLGRRRGGRGRGGASAKNVSGQIRAEVLLKMREVQRDAEDGLVSGGRQITVAVLAEQWLRHRGGELSVSTLKVRTWAVRQHLVPVLGGRRVRQLSAEDGSVLLQELAVTAFVPTPAGPRRQGRSLTVEQATVLLAAAQGHPLEAAFAADGAHDGASVAPTPPTPPTPWTQERQP